MSSCLGIVLLAAKAMALSIHHRQNISELQKDSSQEQEKKPHTYFLIKLHICTAKEDEKENYSICLISYAAG